MNRGYYRFPTVFREKVVFTSEDDLWEVSLHGGLARRLTAGRGSFRHPQYSPSGRWLAFTSAEEGHDEVYIMPSGGGDLRRLTYLGSFSVPCGWLDDGTVLFRSPGFEAHRVPTICRVGVAGGLPQSLRLGPAANLALSMSGRVVLERNDLRADPAHWKRYRGGRTGKLWIAHDIEGEFTPLIRLNGNLTRPLWVGTRVYFVSDHEGVGNLFSCTAEGEDLRSETRHTDFYARTRRPTADPSSITQAAIFMPSMWKHGNRESSPSNTTRNALSVNGVSFLPRNIWTRRYSIPKASAAYSACAAKSIRCGISMDPWTLTPSTDAGIDLRDSSPMVAA